MDREPLPSNHWFATTAIRIENSFNRAEFATFCFVLLFPLSLGASFIVFNVLFGVDEVISLLLGVVVWLLLMYKTVDSFLASVPEVTGLLTVNVFTGALVPYGPGLHYRYPWEQVKEGNFINLRIITEEMVETYPSKDGPLMHVKWSFQYRPHLSRLATYIAVGDDTIKNGVKDVGSSVLSANIAETNAANCKKYQQQFEHALWEEFGKHEPTPAHLYGIDLIRTSLADVDYDKAVQDARSTRQVSKILIGVAKNIKKSLPHIHDKDAMNTALIKHGLVKKDVVEVEGQGGKALAGLFMGAMRGRREK